MSRPRRTARRGLTLLEVILAVALVVVLMGAVYALYRHTLDVRDTLRREADTRFALRRVLDLMSRDLGSCVDIGLAFGFRGSSGEVSFLRAVMPSPAVYYTAAATRRRAADGAGGAFELHHDVELVRYLIEEGEEEGKIGPLRRNRLKALRSGAVEEEVDVESVALSHQIKFLYLEYFTDGEWSESWGGKGLPPAVRITLGTQPLPEGTAPREYPYETVRREVAIPAGGGGQADATSRRGRPGR